MKNKFYITTSIAYTNAPPHIGHALELTQADVLARYHKSLGEDVFFLTGTDEHGLKIARKSKESGKSPKEFVDEIVKQFKELIKELNISNNDFIRTTDKKKHWPIVEKIWKQLFKNGDIYLKEYEGYYCSGCEAFIIERTGHEAGLPICLTHGPCEPIKEKNYFFRLSNYTSQIKSLLQDNKVEIIPMVRKNEMIALLDQEWTDFKDLSKKRGPEDISFSRDRGKLQWGIPVPGDNTQTIYVWADALINYLYPKKYWPADVHCIGKDILKFHAIIWLGILLSLKLPLPKKIFVHGHITLDGQKISKSLGNVVDPFKLIQKYGADAVRYFLLREIPSTEDGDFTEKKFTERYNSDLASGLGNLVARVVTLAKNSNYQFSISNQFSNSNFQIEIDKTKTNCARFINDFKFNEALIPIWGLISFCDAYIDKERPWEEKENQKEIIGNLLYVIYNIAQMLQSFLPETAGKIIKQLKTQKNESLFPRVEKK